MSLFCVILMTSSSELYIAVFSRLIESFLPRFNALTSAYDESLHNNENSVKLSTLLNDFCKNTPLYGSVVTSMCDLAKTHTSNFLQNLIDLFINAIILQEPGIFSLLLTHNPITLQSSKSSHDVCIYLALYISTDIIGEIIHKYGTSDQGANVARCAFKICDPSVQIEIHEFLLKRWSTILAVASLTCFQEVKNLFNNYIDSVNNEILFPLISKIRLDANLVLGSVFLEEIVTVLKGMQKRKELSSKIFSCVASILSSVNYRCEALQKIYDIVNYEKEDSKVKDGAFELMVTLFQVLPNKEGEVQKFFQKRVYIHAGEERKTERDLKLFSKLLSGSYQSQEVSENDISFIGMTGANASDLPPVFMNIYFKKANFAICPQMFSNIILHLASINYTYFLKDMLPSFLQLQMTDMRFIVLLSVVEQINSESFKKFSVSKVEQKDIDTLNLFIRGKIYQNLNCLQSKEEKYVPLQYLEGAWRRISQADQKVQMFLEQNNLDKFEMLLLKYNLSRESEYYALDVQLLRVLSFVLENNDFVESGVLVYICQCCNSQRLHTALAAINLAEFIFKIPELQMPFAKALIENTIKSMTKESLFVALKLLMTFLNHTQKAIPQPVLHDIQFYCFIGIVSSQPNTRILAWKVLEKCDELLDHKGLMFYIHQAMPTIDKYVRMKLFKKTGNKDDIMFRWVSDSRYYEVWLFYIHELVEVVLATNYTPLMQRISDHVYGFLMKHGNEKVLGAPVVIALCTIYLGSKVNMDAYLRCPQVYNVPLFEKRSGSVATSSINILYKMIEGSARWNDHLAFSIIKYLNISYAGDVAEILSACKPQQMREASTAFLTLLDSPQFNDRILSYILVKALNFLTAMHGALFACEATSLRTITRDQEKNVVRAQKLCENYCQLIIKIATKNVLVDDWSLSSREVVLRGLLNWAQTETPVLEPLRKISKQALATLAKAGPMFGDSMVFDKSACEIFGEIEFEHYHVLSQILFYHVRLILIQFCDACLTSSRATADLFFDALFVIFTAGSDFNANEIGCLLLVGLVYEHMQHPNATAFMDAFTASVYEGLGGATESIFCEAFRILSIGSYHTPVKEIVNVLRSFIPEIRLLPKQDTCTESPEKFKIYTPYQFLTALMQATEAITEEYASTFYWLWNDLLEKTDHEEIVPIFIIEWENIRIKQKLLLWLINQNAPYIVEKVISRCSFSYFVHVASKGRSFRSEDWVIQLFSNAFEGRIGSVPSIIAVLHFAFMFFKIPKTQMLLISICKHFDIPPPSSSHDEDMVVTVSKFIEKLSEDDPELNEDWGTEALRWLFGSNKLKFATFSLKIYNQIQKPVDKNIINGMIKVVHYYVSQYENDPLCLADLITEAFRFFSTNFPENELTAFTFASAFLDCSAFPPTCRAESVNIFLKSLNSPATNKQAWSLLPSIVRPLLSSIEFDERSRQILEILTKTSSSNELMMIAAPLKEAFGGFSFTMSTDALLEKVHETILCKAIEHYSLMIESATDQLSGPIFRIASLIVNKVKNENIRENYAVLYKAALNMIGACPNAMQFVIAIAEHNPDAAITSGLAFTDWERSFDDVVRALSRMLHSGDHQMPRSSSIPKLSDSMSLPTIIGFIGSGIMPKVIPFTMQRKVIKEMKRVVRDQSKFIKKVPSKFIKGYQSVTTMKFQKFTAGNWELKPLEPPQQLLGKIPVPDSENTLVMEYSEFDASYSL